MKKATAAPKWIKDLYTAVDQLKQVRESLPAGARNLSQKARQELLALRPIIPYCIHPARKGPNEANISILLNRDYLPIGQFEAQPITWVDYSRCKKDHVLSLPDGLAPDGWLYFFGDGSAPWNSLRGLDLLLERLSLLQEEIFYSPGTLNGPKKQIQAKGATMDPVKSVEHNFAVVFPAGKIDKEKLIKALRRNRQCHVCGKVPMICGCKALGKFEADVMIETIADGLSEKNLKWKLEQGTLGDGKSYYDDACILFWSRSAEKRVVDFLNANTPGSNHQPNYKAYSRDKIGTAAARKAAKELQAERSTE